MVSVVRKKKKNSLVRSNKHKDGFACLKHNLTRLRLWTTCCRWHGFRVWLKFALEFQFQILCACCCLWPLGEAFWFSDMSLPKWLPGSHIGFFGSRILTLVCLWITYPNFSSTLPVCMEKKPIDFQRCHLQNDRMVAILDFSVSGLLTLVWLWISSPNFSSKLRVCMERSLLIFSNVTFKMAAWWPYRILLVSGLKL